MLNAFRRYVSFWMLFLFPVFRFCFEPLKGISATKTLRQERFRRNVRRHLVAETTWLKSVNYCFVALIALFFKLLFGKKHLEEVKVGSQHSVKLSTSVFGIMSLRKTETGQKTAAEKRVKSTTAFHLH